MLKFILKAIQDEIGMQCYQNACLYIQSGIITSLTCCWLLCLSYILFIFSTRMCAFLDLLDDSLEAGYFGGDLQNIMTENTIT